jgi:tRNA (cmo5U34)-methyltransferase
MRADKIFLGATTRAGSFEFNAEVAQAFDDMIVRSIPFYSEQQHMMCEIAKKFWIEGTNIYDLGCSTGTTLINLCREIAGLGGLIGYDNSTPMLERARLKIKEAGCEDRIELRYGDLNGDPSIVCLDDASVVTLCWTMQFVRPSCRDNLIRWICNSLVEGGALVVTEKILTNNIHVNRLLSEFYYDFKRRNNYTEQEIMRKREALENVLIPYQIDENLEMFRRSGFQIVETFFQWYNFAGFLCVKKSSPDFHSGG